MDIVRLPRVSSELPVSSRAERPTAFARVLGHSASIERVIRKARLLADVDTPLLLQGETGVGKEVFARAIHESGKQRNGPFVALNCGGLSRELLASELFGYVDGAFTGARRTGLVGKLEAAHGGTLFLDEISEMPMNLQPYFLRVLEGGEFYPLGSNKPRRASFRLIAACNVHLLAEVTQRRFRMDLFYRVAVTSLLIPALRERPEDIPVLVDHFAREVSAHHGLSLKRFDLGALRALAAYPWPGNIRELRNVVESSVLLAEGDVIGRELLPADLHQVDDSGEISLDAQEPPAALHQVERFAIDSALRNHGGNLSRVARELQIARSTLYLKLKKHSLESVVNDMRLRPEPV
jgi:transcriptional regulator with PAS, ATPase and Fis domain